MWQTRRRPPRRGDSGGRRPAERLRRDSRVRPAADLPDPVRYRPRARCGEEDTRPSGRRARCLTDAAGCGLRGLGSADAATGRPSRGSRGSPPPGPAIRPKRKSWSDSSAWSRFSRFRRARVRGSTWSTATRSAVLISKPEAAASRGRAGESGPDLSLQLFEREILALEDANPARGLGDAAAVTSPVISGVWLHGYGQTGRSGHPVGFSPVRFFGTKQRGTPR